MTRLVTAKAGLRGFDTNSPLSTVLAKAFCKHGYDFTTRYVPRIAGNTGKDISADEVDMIFSAGLMLTLVQHVESESSWLPTSDKGLQYGETAYKSAAAVGMPAGSMIWLDLEGVAPGTPDGNVWNYCANWWDQVNLAGFLPGLYVGWDCGLTPHRLYGLPFSRYWGAYNLNKDQEPSVRGLCMKQYASTIADHPITCGIPPFDVNVTMDDKLGGSVTLVAAA